MTKVSLTVNGSVLSAEVEPRTHLADLLRETHNLTGTHIGCEHGVCGACTLLVDDVPIRSCITFAVACENAKVTTIEGLDEDEIARELRAAFTAHHALAMRLLHARHDCFGARHRVAHGGAERARHPRRDERQSLPMHGLCRHRARDRRASLPTGARAASRPSPEAVASDWGRPDLGRAGETRAARRRDRLLPRRSRRPTCRHGGRSRAGRNRLEAASRVPAELRRSLIRSKRYGPSSAASKTLRNVCPARRSMAARRTAWSTAG